MGFKVGDRVRHECGFSKSTCRNVGRVGEIKTVKEFSIEVLYDGDALVCYASEDYLRLVTPVESMPGKLDESRRPEVQKKGPPYLNIESVNVSQAFKDADPERVAIAFQKDLAQAAEKRVTLSGDVKGPAEGGLPSDAAARKAIPLCTGVLDYFPDAIAAIAECSRVGNDQHNPGQPLHWAKEKSFDHEDALLRHLVDRGKIDTDGVRHSAKVAWRACAMLQTEIDNERKARKS